MSERETRARRSDGRARSTTSASRRREKDEPEARRGRERPREKPREKPASKTREPEGSDGAEPKAASRINARRAAVAAARYVQEMTGRRPEGMTSLNHTEDGWQVGVEVLESKRIPDSTDILAVYQVDLDQDGELVSYRRERRYHRGRVEGEDQ